MTFRSVGYRTCWNCNGSGSDEAQWDGLCFACDGDGELEEYEDDADFDENGEFTEVAP